MVKSFYGLYLYSQGFWSTGLLLLLFSEARIAEVLGPERADSRGSVAVKDETRFGCFLPPYMTDSSTLPEPEQVTYPAAASDVTAC